MESITVKFAQEQLKKLGFDPGPIDGIDGARTQSAVQAYYGKPVSLFKETFRQTPNFSKGVVNEKKGVIFHHSSGSFSGGIDWILKAESQVSYHCLINTDGERCTFAPDWARAWHAGKSSFKGREHCNNFMLGVSFTGDTNTRELTKQEIDSALEWLSERWEKYEWTLDWITDHRTVSPGRKDDLHIKQFDRLMSSIKNKFT